MLKAAPTKDLEQFPSRISVTRLNSRREERFEIKPRGLDQEMLAATRAPRMRDQGGALTCRYHPWLSNPASSPGLPVRFRCEMDFLGASGAPEFPFRFVLDFLKCNTVFTGALYNFRFTAQNLPEGHQLETCGRLENGLTIAGADFIKWKANHHDHQPGGGRRVSSWTE